MHPSKALSLLLTLCLLVSSAVPALADDTETGAVESAETTADETTESDANTEVAEAEVIETTALKKIMFTVDTASVVYDGTAQTKTVTSALTEGEDYVVSYSNNTNAGTATLTITGTGAYDGTLNYTFKITKAERVFSISAEKTELSTTGGTVTLSVSDNAADDSPTYTRKVSDSKVLTVSKTAVVTPLTAGSATVTITAATTDNYLAASAQITFTVVELPAQSLTFPDGTETLSATYGDAAFTVAATNTSEGGGAVSYVSSDTAVATVDDSGAVTIVGAGEAVITATAAEVDGVWAETSVSYTLTVSPKAISVTIDDQTIRYGTALPDFTAVLDAGESLASGDTLASLKLTLKTTATATSAIGAYEITGTSASENYAVTVTSGTLTIMQGSHADLTAAVNAQRGATASYDLSALFSGVTDAVCTDLTADGDGFFSETPTISDMTLSFTLASDETGALPDSAAISFRVSSSNYEDFTVTLTVSASALTVPALTASALTVVYSGAAVEANAVQTAAEADGAAVSGTWSWADAATSIVRVADSGVYTLLFTPDDTESYAVNYVTVSVTVQKASPSGTPGYTSITSSGYTLADAALTTGDIDVAGSIAWELDEDTEVKANTYYAWVFTPTDTDNYETLNGTLRVWRRSSSRWRTTTTSTTSKTTSSATTSSADDDDDDEVLLSFDDVDEDDYYYDAVLWAVNEGVTLGTDSTTFSPEQSCTRAQVVTFLYRAAGYPDVEGGNPFTDVSGDDYYYEAVLWAVENGVTDGTDEGTFSPDTVCTRAQVVTFLYRCVGEDTDSDNPFADVDADDYYYNAILWALEAAVTDGTSDDTFSPAQDCTRAQVVTFLYRALS
ncbi:MAG: S-layer homology domain-containing protein [Oscillospiraceae bacterium]|nr:S-layer homology domain-containing protein [Oscillospiraceae bacterium]